MKDSRLHLENGIPVFPIQRGTYALHLWLNHPKRKQVGRLGKFSFPPGDYLYIGSALGPGGLAARLSRHLRGISRLHWHIDWLRRIADVVGVYYLTSNLQYECKWSQYLLSYPRVTVPAPGFGASDCMKNGRSCASHLICFESGMHSTNIRNSLSDISGSKVMYCLFKSDS